MNKTVDAPAPACRIPEDAARVEAWADLAHKARTMQEFTLVFAALLEEAYGHR